jgi:hypothetical protein
VLAAFPRDQRPADLRRGRGRRGRSVLQQRHPILGWIDARGLFEKGGYYYNRFQLIQCQVGTAPYRWQRDRTRLSLRRGRRLPVIGA